MDSDGGAGPAPLPGRLSGGTAAGLPPAVAPTGPGPRIARLDLGPGAWLRHGLWTPEGPATGTVVMLGGRSEYLEKHDPIARCWTARGFQAFGFDWRGQGLSSRFLSERPPLRQRGYVEDYGVLLDDLDAFLERIVAPAALGPLVLFGHSMGGHLALRHLAERHRDRFSAAVLSAPMTDVHAGPPWIRRAVVRAVARCAVRLGLGAAYAPGQHDYDARREPFEGNPVTSDRELWALHHRWFRAVPDLVLGGVTYAWLDATLRSIELLNRPGAGAGIDVPMLVLVPGLDSIVPPASQEALGRRHPQCRIRVYPDALHEVMLERSGIRSRVWTDIDAFLDEAGAAALTGSPPPPG